MTFNSMLKKCRLCLDSNKVDDFVDYLPATFSSECILTAAVITLSITCSFFIVVFITAVTALI